MFLLYYCRTVGWLDWTLDFRNMLVHRGRRFEYGQFVPRSPILYGADAQRLLRARRVTAVSPRPRPLRCRSVPQYSLDVGTKREGRRQRGRDFGAVIGDELRVADTIGPFEEADDAGGFVGIRNHEEEAALWRASAGS